MRTRMHMHTHILYMRKRKITKYFLLSAVKGTAPFNRLQKLTIRKDIKSDI